MARSKPSLALRCLQTLCHHQGVRRRRLPVRRSVRMQQPRHRQAPEQQPLAHQLRALMQAWPSRGRVAVPQAAVARQDARHSSGQLQTLVVTLQLPIRMA